MKSRTAIGPALLTALLAIAPTTNVNASDVKNMSLAQCQPYGMTSTYDTLAIRADRIQNKTTNSNKYVICPVDKDAQSGWTDGTASFAALFDPSVAGTYQCTLTVGSALAAAGPMVATSQNAHALEGGLWGVFFNDVAGEYAQAGTMVCRLPPKGSLLLLQLTEDQATDDPPPAP
jgi:hypothetical protein